MITRGSLNLLMLCLFALVFTLVSAQAKGHPLRHISLDSEHYGGGSSGVQLLVAQGNIQQAEQQIVDALAQARANNEDNAVALGVHALGHLSLLKNLYPLALTQFQTSLNYFKSTNQSLAIADLYTDIGRTYRVMGLYQSALSYFNLAKEIYHQQNRNDGIALQQLEIGVSLRQLGQFESALSQLERALPLLRETNDNAASALALMNIARVYSDVGKNDQALLYLKDAEQLIRTLSMSLLNAELGYHLGKVYASVGNYDDALRYLNSSIEGFSKLGALCDKGKATASYGEALIAGQQYAQGRQLLLKELTDATANNCTTLLTDIHLALADAYLPDDQEKAQYHIEAGLEQAIDREELYTQSQFQAVRVKLYVQQQNYEAAFEALQRQRKLESTSLDQRRSLALLYLQSQIDAERQAQALTLLSKNQAIELSKAEQQQLRTKMLYGSLMASLLFVFLFWSRVNQKQRSSLLKREVKRRTQELEIKNAELESAYQALERASLLDPLTGLYNRQYLNNQLPQEIHRAQQNYLVHKPVGADAANADLVCFLLDIDNFKHINDTYGHLAGDRILIQLSKLLRSVFRPSDMLIRWGGEEFLAVCRNTSRLEAVTLATRLHQSLHQESFSLNDQTRLKITCSIGFCVLPLYPDDPTKLEWSEYFAILDDCLYAAKSSGKDCWIGLLGEKSRSQHQSHQLSPLEEKYNLPPTRIQTSLNHLSAVNWNCAE
ncbi:diguanylate cyclase [Alteromonas sp. AMM-1]|uniref:tetratricopeptide repeat-containing diguanylate cyclase n=1 Tax=Alteromonas sp. AMM-1 TaxID=3394233 RepID=UPI0039A56D50